MYAHSTHPTPLSVPPLAPATERPLRPPVTNRPRTHAIADDDFRTFFREDFSKLVALAASITGDVIFAEDLAQEAMARTHRDWDKVRELDKPGAWVRRVLINLALSRRRRAGREARALLRLREPAPAIFPSESNSPVLELLAELPPRQRAVVSLHYIDDLPVDAVAEIVGIKPSTVRTHLNHARQLLRTRLTAASPSPSETTGDSR